LYFHLLEADVTLRAVNGDRDLQDAIYAVLRGQRNNQDAEAKGAHVRRGLEAATKEGTFLGGQVATGYAIEKEIVNGKLKPKIIKHPEDEATFDLLWRLAEKGSSASAIASELNRRGLTYTPQRGKGAKPFDADRVKKILQNPFYTGCMVRSKDKVVTTQQTWPPYVTVETWQRLKAQRRENYGERKRGRPPEGYLLAGLAICRCGKPMHVITGKRVRKDGTRAKAYECRAHKEHLPDDPNYCAATPFDAREVDALVQSELFRLLENADSLRERMTAGSKAERKRLTKEVERATADVKRYELAAEKADQKVMEALADGNQADTFARVADRSRSEVESAKVRLDAALDALNDEGHQPEPEAIIDQLWADLSARFSHVRPMDVLSSGRGKTDLKVLNLALRETFAGFQLERTGSRLKVTPELSEPAYERARMAAVLGLRSPLKARIGQSDGDPEIAGADEPVWSLEFDGPEPLTTDDSKTLAALPATPGRPLPRPSMSLYSLASLTPILAAASERDRPCR
jgi:hypothetical protein